MKVANPETLRDMLALALCWGAPLPQEGNVVRDAFDEILNETLVNEAVFVW